MSRKCFPSIPSSFASVYLITAFFAIAFVSLFYLKYPQQYIDHIDFRIKTTTTTTTTRSPFAVNVSDQVSIPASPPDLQPSSSSSPPPPPVVNSPAVNSTTGPTANAKQDDSPTSDEGTNRDLLAPITNSTIVSEIPPVGANEAEKKQNDEAEADDEDEDEASITTYDHITWPPSNLTREERMQWIKQRIPESKLLESTPRTRKFEVKLQRFVQAKQCKVNIFMTWITSMGFFGNREMLCLESVIKAHPHACVIIISRIMATKSGQKIIQPLLDRGHMIFTLAPDFPLLFDGTPAQDWYQRLKAGQLDPGEISIAQNLSNLLRLVVLYKYGGIYLDTDVIILKDVSSLRNSIGVQELEPEMNTWKSVNNAVLIFDKEHPLILRFMEEFNSTFDGSAWGHNGPYMATRIIKKYSHDSNYQFNVMSPMAFYPIDWENVYKFFRNPKGGNASRWEDDMLGRVSKESYGVHLWNNASRKLKIEQGCIVAKLLSEHCIICHDIYGS